MGFLGFWLFGALIGVSAANRKGFSKASGVIAGLLLGPLAFLMYFASGDKVKCPLCVEWVNKKAIVCPHCKNSLVDYDLNDSDKKGYSLLKLVITVVLVIFIIGVVSSVVTPSIVEYEKKVAQNNDIVSPPIQQPALILPQPVTLPPQYTQIPIPVSKQEGTKSYHLMQSIKDGSAIKFLYKVTYIDTELHNYFVRAETICQLNTFRHMGQSETIEAITGDGLWWEPKQGDNVFDIIKFVCTNTK